MYFTGFADEAGADINIQIKATKELGWSNIEMRSTGFKGDIAAMGDADFETMREKLETAGVKINCFGSAIANWGKKIEAPFEETLKDIDVSIPRLQKLGTKLVRIMSYGVRRDPETWQALPDSQQMVEERIKRLKIIIKRFSDAGILAVHENCMNYGGMSWQNTLRLVENVPGLKLVFDTGNPVFSFDAAKTAVNGATPMQDAWEFYSHIKEHIVYVHIKDGFGDAVQTKKGEIFPIGSKFTYPGEGAGKVREIVKDLLINGYDGGFSMEPHMEVVFHDNEKKSRAELQYNTYVEYGKKIMKIVEEAKKSRRL